jgi:hypothetical protein
MMLEIILWIALFAVMTIVGLVVMAMLATFISQAGYVDPLSESDEDD